MEPEWYDYHGFTIIVHPCYIKHVHLLVADEHLFEAQEIRK